MGGLGTLVGDGGLATTDEGRHPSENVVVKWSCSELAEEDVVIHYFECLTDVCGNNSRAQWRLHLVKTPRDASDDGEESSGSGMAALEAVL